MTLSRRRFLGYMLATMFLRPFSARAEEDRDLEEIVWEKEVPPEEKAKNAADSFLDELTQQQTDEIESITLQYDVDLVREGFIDIDMQMSLTLSMKKENDHYIATFNLTEPEGKNILDKIFLFFGRETEDYKELMKAIETRLDERFHIGNGRFMTDELKEILPEVKLYENQTAIRVFFDFDSGLIKFWEDWTQAKFSDSMAYTNQVGPLTGFFNFVLYDQPETNIYVINVLKQVEDVESSEESSPTKKEVDFLFQSETVTIGRTSGPDQYIVSFQRSVFLDIIYGKIKCKLAYDEKSNVKVPYTALVEGIVSKTKQREKQDKLKRLEERQPTLSDKAYEKELSVINAMDILAAKNVKVYLKKASITYS